MATKHIHIHLPARQLGKTKDSPVQSMAGAARVAKLVKALGISLPAAQKKLERADWNYERALGTKDTAYNPGDKVSFTDPKLGKLKGHYRGLVTTTVASVQVFTTENPGIAVGGAFKVPLANLSSGWTRDADNTKYILKKDTLIEGMGGGNQNANRTGRIVPAGTVFYKWQGRYTPSWAKTGPGIKELTDSMFQVEKSSYDAKDAGSTSSLEALEYELDKLQDDIEDLEDKGRSASQAQINRRKALNLQINELKKKE